MGGRPKVYKPLRNWVDEFIPYYYWKSCELRKTHFFGTYGPPSHFPTGSTSWWLSFNPFEKYANVKMDHLISPFLGGENSKTYLSCHHLVNVGTHNCIHIPLIPSGNLIPNQPYMDPMGYQHFLTWDQVTNPPAASSTNLPG